MKRKIFLSSAFVALLSMPILIGCESAVEETPDGYIDALPSETKDGTILHAFCWKYSDVMAQLPYIANAGYKSVQISPVQVPKSTGSSWWAYYQPLAFRIADNDESPLGTKEELKALCSEADKYNVSIIADIVFNHMANISDEELESDGTPKVSPIVAQYEPEIYALRNDAINPTFHHNPNAEGSGAETQYYPYGGLPDLNTANSLVQERSLALLKECIDVGIDGFRFDAAKHIETSKDPDYPSDFWDNTLDVAKQYYKTKSGKELFAYGEVLGSPIGRKVDVYTEHMYVSEGSYGGQLQSALSSRNAATAAKASYGQNTDPSNMVSVVETHDTYTSESSPWSNLFISRCWAMLNSRKDTRNLFLARPDSNTSPSVGIIGDYFFRDETVASINRFRNKFLGCEEIRKGEDTIYQIERYDDNKKGAVVLDFKASEEISVTFEKLGTGVYYDQITGKAVTVRNGKAKIELDKSGICVLTMSKNAARPSFEIDSRGGLYFKNKTVNVTYNNATEATYKINNNAPVSFTSGSSISFGDSDLVDNKIVLEITVKNAQFGVTELFTYKPVTLIEGYFNVVNVPASRFTDNEIYMWSWKSGEQGHWSKDYTVQGTTILVDTKTLGITGMVFGLFDKGYVISDVNAWDTNVKKQTTDITGSVLAQGYYDGSSF